MTAHARRRVVALAALSLAAVALEPVAACASGHIGVHLGSFPREAVSKPFYWASEGEGRVTFVLRAIGDPCEPTPVSVGYATRDGSATSGADYVPASGRAVVFTDPTHSGRDAQPVPVTLSDNPVAEAPVETAFVELRAPEGGYLTAPTTAALHVVDDDGATRMSLDGGDYQHLESFEDAGVAVFRAGNASAAARVDYTISPGPGPAADTGQDVRGATTGRVTFAPGDRIQLIPISVVNDRVVEPTEHLTVSIGSPSGGGVEGAPRVTFAILDNEEQIPPESRLHHPRNKLRYRSTDYRIREIHVFTSDRGGSSVVRAELAIRRNMRGKRCSWWNGKRFTGRSCSKEVWNRMASYEADFFYYRVDALPPSVGRVESYTAFSRAIDGAGNTEREFKPGRNANTFEVKRGGRG